MAETCHLYGLLYVGHAGERPVNLPGGISDPLATYALNAVTLARSAAAHGQPFTLVTNDAQRVASLLEAQGHAGRLELREQAFALDVPEGIPFRSAHYKLELVRLFGTGEFGPLPALVDLDAVLLRLLELPDPSRLWAYDISRQQLGEEPDARAADSLTRLAGRPVPTRWYGGEFLAGPADRYAELAREIDQLWPTYAAEWRSHYHAGDEMVLSAALGRLAQDGRGPAEAGAASLACRWWSCRTEQPGPSLDHALKSAVLHLPADKVFLAEQASEPFDSADFARRYRQSAIRRRPVERAKAMAERLLGRPRTIVPQFT